MSAEGSVARIPLVSGEPVTAQKVIKADGAGFMAAVLTPGMRAVGVKLTTERGAGGFILPNDRVDVIMTRKMGNDGSGVPAYQRGDGAAKMCVFSRSTKPRKRKASRNPSSAKRRRWS